MPSDSAKSAGLGPLEAEVMDVLWARQAPLTVRAVLEELNRKRSQPLAYTTVMTVMSRLWEQDILHRAQFGRGYAYAPTASDPVALAVRSIIREHGETAVTHFVGQTRGDPRLRSRLEELVAAEDPDEGDDELQEGTG